jgi:aspartokinase-like uncharacterized kinase
VHPDIANTRIGVAHAYIAEVVAEGGSEFAERVRQMNATAGLSPRALDACNAEALAALAAEVVELRQQVAELKKTPSAQRSPGKKKALA